MYLETPDFVSNFLHFITILATPLHILGFYCILFKTPDSMKSVKWGMFHIHFWCTLMDWSVTVITVPFLLSPAAAGVPLGIAKVLGIPTDLQCYFALTSVGAMGMALVLIFENRFFLMFARQSQWKFIRNFFIFLNYFVVFSIFIPLLPMVPEQASARKEVIQMLPEISNVVDTNSIFVLTTDVRYILISAIFIETFLSIEALTFISLLSTNFRRMVQSAKHSEKTLRLQKKFLKAIYIQAAVMVLNFELPVTFIIFSTLSKYHNQVVNNMSICILSFHGIVSTIVMLWAHKPFREACLEMVRCGNKVSFHSHISVIPLG